LKSLRDSEREISQYKVIYFMVSLDDSEKNAEFAESLSGNFPLLSDPGKRVAEAYGVLGFAGLYAKRWTFYIDADGVIRHIDKNVKTSSAGSDIALRLAELEFPKHEGASD
jgi:peroxiredoxin Q/BCP